MIQTEFYIGLWGPEPMLLSKALYAPSLDEARAIADKSVKEDRWVEAEVFEISYDDDIENRKIESGSISECLYRVKKEGHR